MNCCENRCSTFTFGEIRNASLPPQKGVYVVRIKGRGAPADKIIGETGRLVEELKWPIVANYIMSRINRHKGISECPIIYIGSTGTRSGSKHTLQGRYQDFCIRHTAMYPLWALVYFGWQLELGWLVNQKPDELEDTLKQEYKKDHFGKLPALVAR